jgi:hypothetical protein
MQVQSIVLAGTILATFSPSLLSFFAVVLTILVVISVGVTHCIPSLE